MINHYSGRWKSYESECRQPLEKVIEEFLLKPGVSIMDVSDQARLLADRIRIWRKDGGQILEEDHIRKQRPLGVN